MDLDAYVVASEINDIFEIAHRFHETTQKSRDETYSPIAGLALSLNAG
jgi:hypothetical protein